MNEFVNAGIPLEYGGLSNFNGIFVTLRPTINWKYGGNLTH